MEKNKQIEENQSESTEPEPEEESETETEKSQNSNASRKSQSRKKTIATKKRKLKTTKKDKNAKKKHKQNQVEDVTTDKPAVVFPAIKTRSSPRDVAKILARLTENQKQNVKEMGFESLLDDNFNINTTPTKLGYWVVDHFDPETCTISMGDGRAILITANMIKEMLGIPMGNLQIQQVRFATTEYPLIVNWRHTYDYPDDRFYLKTVVEKLLTEHHTGLEFKLNFLVAVISILGDCTKNGLVNQKFIQCIEKEEDIKNMDWCTYLLGCMKRSKAEYTKTTGFGGPLLLMVLLYLHSTISEEVEIAQEIPAIKAWDTQKLKRREKQEIDLGGFGKLPIKKGLEFVKKPLMTKKKIQKLRISPAKQLEYAQQEIVRQVYTPRVDLEDGICGIGESSGGRVEAIKKFKTKSSEDMKMEIKKVLSITGNIYSYVDEMLEMASICYPEDVEFKSLVESRNETIMKAFKPGKVAAALESEKDVMDSDEPVNDAHISQEENDTNTDDFFSGEANIDTVMETPEEVLENIVINKGLNDDVGETENDVNEGVDAEVNEGVHEGVNEGENVENEAVNVGNEGVDVEVNEAVDGGVNEGLNVENDGGKNEAVGLNVVEKNTLKEVAGEIVEGVEVMLVEKKSGEENVIEKEVPNEIIEGTEITLVEQTPGVNTSKKNNGKDKGKIKERTISQILVRLDKNSKGESTRIPNASISFTTEKDLEGTKTGVEPKRNYIDFTPPSFNLFSQDDEWSDINKSLNDVMKLPLAQTSDTNDATIQQARETSMLVNEVSKKDAVQRSDEKAGESIKKDAEQPRSENMSVDTTIVKKTSTQQTYVKRPKITIKRSEVVQKLANLPVDTNVADKGKQLLTNETERISPTRAINAVPISCVKPMEKGHEDLGKRVSIPTEVYFSPYVKRKVTITTNLQNVERAVVDCVFSGMLPSMDILFKSIDMEVPRVVFESMYENMPVASAAIDVWSIIQNNDEKLKNKSSSRYVFCRTGMMLTRKADDFKRKMEAVLEYSTKKDLDRVEMVFFPMTMPRENYNHYYLIVYNLKTCKSYIIDNVRDQSQDVIKRYGDTPKALTKAFANYLQSENHPNATKISTKFKILKLEWETGMDRFGSGIFLMRHMETFCGAEKEFKSGLKKESSAQNTQLKSLRKKYVVKMLLSQINEKRKQIEQESKKYESFNDAQKQNFKLSAFPKLQKRVTQYFEDHEEKLRKKWSFLAKNIAANNMM